MAFRELEERNEEFNNFMHRVNEVSNIVKKLSSNDHKMQEIGTLEADQYLKCVHETFDEDTVKLTIKNDRTVINKKAFAIVDENTMSQEAFMEEVSRDADQRYKDRKIRQEKADTLKVQGAKAFRRGEFEKAVTLYTKAIDHIKDSPLLYNNRALAYINLGFYDKAVDDATKALELNETSLKAGLLLAKAYFLKNNQAKFQSVIDDVKNKNQNKITFINEYVEELMTKKTENTFY